MPSDSMEGYLTPGDFVIVNKVSYGVKIPRQVQDVPVIGAIFENNREALIGFDKFSSLMKYKDFEVEDVVVFQSIEKENTNLIKRIVGKPGDTILISDSEVIRNGMKMNEKSHYSYDYVHTDNFGIKSLKTLSNFQYNKMDKIERSRLSLNLNDLLVRENIFPKGNSWARDNYGPIIIPQKGQQVLLTPSNFKYLKYLIWHFEEDNFTLSNTDTVLYTFKNNYYFLMGDNRHNSIDSRYFGLIPENYILGKMIGKFDFRVD